MADDTEQDGQEPNLELPSLFGRKKKKQAEQPEPEAVADPVSEPDGSTEETRRLPPLPPPGATVPPVEPTPGPRPAPTPPPVPEPVPTPEPVPPPEPPPVPEPVPTPDPVQPPQPVQPPAPEPVPEPVPEPAPVPQPDPVLVARAALDDPDETTVLPQVVAEPPQELQQVQTEPQQPPKPPKVKRERKPVVLPRINPYVAAVIAGVIGGLVGVVLSIGTQRGCERVRGVGSCGGFGLVALLVILVVVILLGAVILRAFQVPEATGTSFLGVGIVAVLTMVFFLSSLESAWMFLVIPTLSAVSFAVSYWVTASIVDVPKDEDMSSSVT